MKVTEQVEFDNRCFFGSFEEPSICPICKHALKAQELAIRTFKDQGENWFLSGLYLCNSCYQTFTTLHRCYLDDKYYEYSSELIYVEPNRFCMQSFDPKIENLSPGFVKIYNQALAAETSQLDEIAGLGYRKALEFLVKDYCIHIAPEKNDEIKAAPLGRCISTYIDNHKIKTLASRSAWIGNDEAHYIRKIDGRDISDMKAFIQALVYFVGMELVVEDASSVSPG